MGLPEWLKRRRISCSIRAPAGPLGVLLQLGEEIVERKLGDDALGEDRRRAVDLRARREGGEKRDKQTRQAGANSCLRRYAPAAATSKRDLLVSGGPAAPFGAQPWRAL